MRPDVPRALIRYGLVGLALTATVFFFVLAVTTAAILQVLFQELVVEPATE